MQAEDVAREICNVVKGAEGKLPKADIQRQIVAALGQLEQQGVITTDDLLEAILSACAARSKQAAAIDCGTF